MAAGASLVPRRTLRTCAVALGTIATTTVLASCGSTAAPASQEEPRSAPPQSLTPTLLRFIEAPGGGRLDKPTWVPRLNAIVAVLYPRSESASRWDLYSVRLDGSGLRRLPLCAGRSCRKLSFDFPTLLPNGNLGFERMRLGISPDLGLHGTEILEYDPAGGALRKLVPYGLPQGIRGFTYRPGMRDGLVNNGQGLYEKLLSLEPRAPVVVRLPLTRAGTPTWSPDGRLLAVDGVPSSEKATGLARADLPRTLYVASASNLRLRPLLTRLKDVGPAAWSHDGRWLVARIVPRSGPPGLYLVRVGDGRMFLLRRGDDAGSASWIDDRTLVAAIGVNAETGRRGLVVLRLRLPPLRTLG